jgi:hypothetical protein
MDTIKLIRIRESLEKIAQGAVILPQVTTTSGRRKKKLSPEAVETIKELQETPRDVFSGKGVGSALLSAATGGAVGTGLGALATRTTVAGEPIRLTRAGREALLASQATKGAEELARAKLLRRGRLAGIATTGAGAGLATNVAFQIRKKHLQKKLEEELGNKKESSLNALLEMAASIKAVRLLEE